ncbi:MAG TPA: hypothetical protein EYO59_03280, partial [Chromatiaceae bacterium]|nr:hypothetical protein [Chromatiaceae bacterium]
MGLAAIPAGILTRLSTNYDAALTTAVGDNATIIFPGYLTTALLDAFRQTINPAPSANNFAEANRRLAVAAIKLCTRNLQENLFADNDAIETGNGVAILGIILVWSTNIGTQKRLEDRDKLNLFTSIPGETIEQCLARLQTIKVQLVKYQLHDIRAVEFINRLINQFDKQTYVTIIPRLRSIIERTPAITWTAFKVSLEQELNMAAVSMTSPIAPNKATTPATHTHGSIQGMIQDGNSYYQRQTYQQNNGQNKQEESPKSGSLQIDANFACQDFDDSEWKRMGHAMTRQILEVRKLHNWKSATQRQHQRYNNNKYDDSTNYKRREKESSSRFGSRKTNGRSYSPSRDDRDGRSSSFRRRDDRDDNRKRGSNSRRDKSHYDRQANRRAAMAYYNDHSGSDSDEMGWIMIGKRRIAGSSDIPISSSWADVADDESDDESDTEETTSTFDDLYTGVFHDSNGHLDTGKWNTFCKDVNLATTRYTQLYVPATTEFIADTVNKSHVSVVMPTLDYDSDESEDIPAGTPAQALIMTLDSAYSQSPSSPSFLAFDSGATAQVEHDPAMLQHIVPIESGTRSVIAGIGGTTPITAIGTWCPNFSGILLVPGMQLALFSPLDFMTRFGGYFAIHAHGVYYNNSDLGVHNVLFAKPQRSHFAVDRDQMHTIVRSCTDYKADTAMALAQIDSSSSPPLRFLRLTNKEDATIVMHLKLNHMSRSKMKKALHQGRFPADCGITDESIDAMTCLGCIHGTTTRSAFPKRSYQQRRSVAKLYDIGIKMEADISGPHPPSFIHNHRYYVVVYCTGTKMIFVRCMKDKKNVPTLMRSIFAEMQYLCPDMQFGALKMDEDSVFKSTQMKKACADVGIHPRFAVAYQHQSNGGAETTICNINNRARTALAGANLSSHFWDEAVLAVVPAMIRENNSMLPNHSSPLQHIGQPDDIMTRLAPFGAPCLMQVPKGARKDGTFGTTTTEAILMRYTTTDALNGVDHMLLKGNTESDILTAQGFAPEEATKTSTSPIPQPSPFSPSVGRRPKDADGVKQVWDARNGSYTPAATDLADPSRQPSRDELVSHIVGSNTPPKSVESSTLTSPAFNTRSKQSAKPTVVLNPLAFYEEPESFIIHPHKSDVILERASAYAAEVHHTQLPILPKSLKQAFAG